MSSEDQYSSARTRSQNPDLRPRIALAFGLAAAIVVIQFVGSLMTGSLALLTDTAHALTDASGLLVALIAATLALKPATTNLGIPTHRSSCSTRPSHLTDGGRSLCGL